MQATGYLIIKPVWGKYVFADGSRSLRELTMEKVTKTRPRSGTFGAAVIKLSVDVPDHVFKPFEVDAEISVDAREVGTVRVVVEPFQEDEG